MLQRHLLFLLAVIAASAASLLAQNQGQNSTEKHGIALETDSGRYGVSAEKLDAKRLGVPIYPGARLDKREDNQSDASLSLDWGKESTHLYVQKYISSDSPEKVLSFYRKQLSKYGPVLECRDGKPLNSVSVKIKCDSDDDQKGIELKAGTEEKQHIVGVTSSTAGTEFGLVYLEQTTRTQVQ